MAARKTTDLTALTTPTANTLVPAVDLTETLASNQNKKLALSDLTKDLSAAPGGAYITQPGSYFEIKAIGSAGSNSTNGTWSAS